MSFSEKLKPIPKWQLIFIVFLFLATGLSWIISSNKKTEKEIPPQTTQSKSMGVSLQDIITRFNSIADDKSFAPQLGVEVNKIPSINTFTKTNESGRTRLSYELSPSINIMFDVDQNMVISSGAGVFGNASKETAKVVMLMAASFYGKSSPEIEEIFKLCTNTEPQRATIGKLGVTCGFKNSRILMFSIYPDDGEAKKIDTHSKNNHYQIQDGLKYGYTAELSSDDVRSGKVANTVVMFSFAGQHDGKYQVHVIDGSVLTAAECSYPCEYIKIMRAIDSEYTRRQVNMEVLKAAPNMLAYLALQDAINGKLEPYVLTNSNGRFTVWMDEEKGIIYTREKK